VTSLEAFQLYGKNALVTGSRKGLGSAIATALAQAGANVGCHGRDANPGSVCDEIRALGRKTFYFAGDVASAEICSRLIDKTIAEFGSIDILVNNAGTIRRAPAADFSAEYWNEVIAVNLTAVFHLSQLAGQQMLKQGKPGKNRKHRIFAFVSGRYPRSRLRCSQRRRRPADESTLERMGGQADQRERDCSRLHGNGQHSRAPQ
jgi:NAD(P)-dependent dehydrogenase (short-subunit alcohol dehydrogenase family)